MRVCMQCVYIYTGVEVDGSIRPREDGTVPAYICTPRRRVNIEEWDELFAVSSLLKKSQIESRWRNTPSSRSGFFFSLVRCWFLTGTAQFRPLG